MLDENDESIAARHGAADWRTTHCRDRNATNVRKSCMDERDIRTPNDVQRYAVNEIVIQEENSNCLYL